MATRTTAGTSFPAELASEMFNKVQGHSALAKLSAEKPIPFNGQTVFTFSAGGEAAIVGEGGNKPAGDVHGLQRPDFCCYSQLGDQHRRACLLWLRRPDLHNGGCRKYAL